MSKLITLVLVFLMLGFTTFADTFDDLILNLKAVNMKEVVKIFNQNLEINIDGTDGVYSKPQAEVMLKNFITNNPPKTLVIVHRGASAQGAQYIIADYVTAHNKYRLYVFMKSTQNQTLVHELRIEKE